MQTKKLIDEAPELSLIEYGKLSDDVEMWVDRYLENCLHLSKNTIKSYREALLPFIRFCEQYDGVMQLDEIGAKFVNHYIADYIKELADYRMGQKVLGVRGGGERDSPDDLDDEEYEKILDNGGRRLNRDASNVYVPRRFEKSVMHRLTTLKQLFKHISLHNTEGHDFRPLFARFVRFKRHGTDTDFLSLSELETLRQTCTDWPKSYMLNGAYRSSQSRRREVSRSNEFAAVRGAFFILLISYTGLRASETMKLRLSNFKRVSVNGQSYYSISVHEGKGGKDREVVAPAAPLEVLYERYAALLGEDLPLASDENAKSVTYATLYTYAKRIYHAAGIGQKGFHMLRRSFATEYIAKGGDIETLAKLLGHASIQMTHDLYVKNNPELLMLRSVH